ncbi:MAG: hypothetical protein ACYCUM_08605 [Solirubrobacteraceae bacterium]
MQGTRAIATAGLALLASTALGACGSSNGPRAGTSASPLPTPGQAGTGSASSHVPAVAHVASTPITKASYEHWLSVERALGERVNPAHRALGFLISSSWVLGEAADRHVSVSEAEVHRRLSGLERRSFPKQGQLAAYLKRSHQSEADLLARVKVESLQAKLSEAASRSAKGASARAAALASFQKTFVAHWKPLTSCEAGYVMEDCRQYRGGPEPGLSNSSTSSSSRGHAARGERASGRAASSGGSPSSGGSSPGAGSSPGGGSPPGAAASPAGAFAISSPAFARNGQIPAKYTCSGAGVSPPLEWSNVPKGASELVLFVIDDSSNGSEGGIRWILAGINPSSRGVQAGRTPPGAIAGRNTAGRAAYSPICPAKGRTDTIELVMYALKHPISLSSGFEPAVAEHDYGSTKDLLGQAALSYAVASRK